MTYLRAVIHLRAVGLGIVLMIGSTATAKSQTPDTTSSARPTGLPKKLQWKFNLDAGVGAFGFGNSLYTDVRPDPSGNLGDDWVESYAKAALSADRAFGGGTLYGKASVVGERTFAAPPSIVGEDASSFQVEDAYLGWRSGKAFSMGEDVVDVTVGRAPYKIGQGFLLWDGGGEGGSRGGFWSNARKAWEFAGVARFKPKNHTLEAFYLDRSEVPESRTGTTLWGLNYDLALGEANTIGATYLMTYSDSLPNRDNMSVYNLRAYVSPFKRLPGLSLGAEYAREDNGSKLGSTAWMAQAAYELGSVTWKPKLSYRYAYFQGDDPSTEKSEAFDPLFLGFYDWGTWWQGEIAGEYFLSNSNNISHQARVHFAPTESLGTGLIWFLFKLDQPASFGPNVTSKNVASELDAYADWKVNSNFTMSFVLAYGNPQEALAQGYQRTSNFSYGMVYLTYSY
jgi:hypothetical protein